MRKRLDVLTNGGLPLLAKVTSGQPYDNVTLHYISFDMLETIISVIHNFRNNGSILIYSIYLFIIYIVGETVNPCT